MIHRIALLFVFAVLVACGSDSPTTDSSLTADEIVPSQDSLLPEPQPRPGEWVREGGEMRCDGYLSPIEDDQYCSETPYQAANPYEFEGEVYFVQKLSMETEAEPR